MPLVTTFLLLQKPELIEALYAKSLAFKDQHQGKDDYLFSHTVTNTSRAEYARSAR